jgi:hypothetical protein
MTFDPGPQPASEHPLMLYQGQPISREGAASLRAELMAKPEYANAFQNNDGARLTELRHLYQLQRGQQPGDVPVAPSDAASVQAQMSEREQHLQEARLDTWAKHFRMDDVQRAEAKRGLATQQQVDDAKREIRRMLDDQEFGAKVLRGDMDAKDRWARFNLIAAMRIAPDGYDWAADTLDKFK